MLVEPGVSFAFFIAGRKIFINSAAICPTSLSFPLNSIAFSNTSFTSCSKDTISLYAPSSSLFLTSVLLHTRNRRKGKRTSLKVLNTNIERYDYSQIHWLFDNFKVVWNTQLDRIHRLSEHPPVFMIH